MSVHFCGMRYTGCVVAWLCVCVGVASEASARAPLAGGAASRPAAGAGAGAAAAGLRPVPGDAAQAEARAALKEKFGKDYADISEAGKRRLAGILLRAAATTAADAPLYVTLAEARELASAVGEVELALQAAGEVIRQFAVDAEATRYATLVSCSQRRLTPGQSVALAREAKSVAEARLAEDDFDGASRAANLAEEVSRRSGDPSLQAQLALMADFLREMLRQLPKFREAMSKLERDADDPAANQTAGEFLTLVKQEWGRGLVMLTRGTDALLKAAAAVELSGLRGGELARAGDAWAKLGEKKTGPGRVACVLHARGLYERAAGDLSGAEQQLCLERVGAMVNALPGGSNLADLQAARAALGDARYGWWESARFDGLESRDDAGELKVTQAVVAWHPRLEDRGEVPQIPEGSGEPKEVRLTYRLDQLVVDEAGRETVLRKSGKVQLRDPSKPVHLAGASVKDVRRLNAGRVVPAGAHVEIYLDGVKVYERTSKLPVKRAWWLDEGIVVKAEKN